VANNNSKPILPAIVTRRSHYAGCFYATQVNIVAAKVKEMGLISYLADEDLKLINNVFLDLESLPVYCIYHNLGNSRAIAQVWPRIRPNTGWLCNLDESGYHLW